jgi:hypothetical protein
MAIDPEITTMLANLGEIAARNTAGAVNTRVRAVRAQRRHEETVSELEDIVNELLDDRSELLRIARALEEELVAQRISPAEIEYITEKLIPTAEKLMELAGEEAGPASEAVDAIKTLVSTEMLTVLQLVGFNFKAAIGEPLTLAVQRLILAAVPIPDEASAATAQLQLRREVAMLEVIKDPDAAQRLSALQ